MVDELERKVKMLEKQKQGLEGQLEGKESTRSGRHSDDSSFGKELQKLKLENSKLTQQLKEMKEVSLQFEAGGSNPESQDINKLKRQLKEQIVRANELEGQLVEAKMGWASLDMEAD